MDENNTNEETVKGIVKRTVTMQGRPMTLVGEEIR